VSCNKGDQFPEIIVSDITESATDFQTRISGCDVEVDWDISYIPVSETPVLCPGVNVQINSISLGCDCWVTFPNIVINAYKKIDKGDLLALWQVNNIFTDSDPEPINDIYRPFGSLIVESLGDNSYDIIPTAGFGDLVTIEICLSRPYTLSCPEAGPCGAGVFDLCHEEIANTCIHATIGCQ